MLLQAALVALAVQAEPVVQELLELLELRLRHIVQAEQEMLA